MSHTKETCKLASLVSVATVILISLFLGVSTLFLGVSTSSAEGAEPESMDAKAKAAPQVAAAPPLRLPMYNPPKVGKPARTVGGGSRGPGDGIPDLYVLVPDHVGRTESAQPDLFWYVDDLPSGAARVDFTLLDEDGIDPMVETTLAKLEGPGIQRIALSDFGVKLEADTEYEWSIALVVDPDDRSKDIISTGFIDCVKSSGSPSDVYGYAQQGLWYDAMTALEAQIRAQPENEKLPQMRAALLRQVGLDAVADGTL